MYRCLCGAVFDRPHILRGTERCGGFSRRVKYLLCPVCGLGEQYFDELTEEGEGPGPEPGGSVTAGRVQEGV